MTEDELNELEYLRAWNEDLNEKQFNRLKQLEMKASSASDSRDSVEGTSISTVENEGRRAQIPFAADGGAGSPYTATPMKPQWVGPNPRTSDIIAESRQEGKMGPIARKRFIEGENELMQKLIEREQEAYEADPRENNLAAPLTEGYPNLALSLIAPASAEAYSAGRYPGLADLGVDIGLAGASLYASPAKGAAMLSKSAPKLARVIAPSTNVVKNMALESGTAGALSGLAELAQSEINDRDYVLTAPLVSAGLGGVLGTMTGGQVKKLRGMGFSDEEIPDVISKLAPTTESTRKSLNPSGKKDFGATEIVKYTDLADNPVSRDFVRKSNPSYKRLRGVEGGVTAENTYPLDEVQSKIALIRKSLDNDFLNGMPTDTYNKKMKILDSFEKKVADRSEAITNKELKYYVDLASQGYDSGITSTLENKFKETADNPKVFGVGLLNDIQDVPDQALRTDLLQSIPKEKNLVAPLLAESRYAAGVEKIPDIIESGTILQTLKNVPKAPPHVSKTVQEVLRPAARTAVQKRRTVDEEGNIVYAPEGQQTYEWLWEQASKGGR